MGGANGVSGLAELRKRVQKASVDELNEGSLLDDALDAVCSNLPEETNLDVFALLLVLTRKLRAVLPGSPPRTHDLVHTKLGAALLPTGTLAVLLLNNLESTKRLRQARAADCLSASVRMAEELNPPSAGASTYIGMLTPLFEHICRGELGTKPYLTVINILLRCVPPTAVPKDILPKLLSQMGMTDAASSRGSILCQLLVDLHASTDGDDSKKATAVVEMVIPMIKSADTSALTNTLRYLLPSLFKAIPKLPTALLARLEPIHSRNATSLRKQVDVAAEGSLPAWIAVASLCVSTNQLSLSDLSTQTLTSAMEHADPTVRIDTVRLLISSRELLQLTTLDLLKRSILLCSTLSEAYARSEFSATLASFFKSLKIITSLPRSSKGEIDALESFLAWLLDAFIDPGLAGALRFPVVKVVLALNVLSTFVVEFETDIDTHRRIFTRSRVEALLACQACDFAEVRSKARAILAVARVPLSGYRSLDVPAAQVLLASAIASVNHPRKTQADAGKAVLCILFEILVKQRDSDQACRTFIITLVDDLETRLQIAELHLVEGMTESPLHGVISAISGVIYCLKLRGNAQHGWKPLFARLVSLIDRIWTVTSRVVSLWSEDASDRPDHEIARAYEVMAGDTGADEEGMDHTNLLSGCWRATTESAELLAALACLPLVQLGPAQAIWSSSDIDGFGRRFLTWLHGIRHRGTFSKIAVSFGKVVSDIKDIGSLRSLCGHWLDLKLDTITTKSFSTTRRSAALPYSVLALVVADRHLLEVAVERLVDIARVTNKTSDDVTRVHAFNILRIILLDTRTARHLDRFFETVVVMALEAFASANWNVRNVGLVLFSSLVHRSLGSSEGTQDYFQSRQHLSKRQTLQSWNAKYPAIVPFLRKELQAATQPESVGHGSLFPILIILRSLRWSSNDGGLADAIRPEVKPFLGSKEWQVRQIAAQALSSLYAPHEASKILVDCSEAYQTFTTVNERHGHLLFWTHLVTAVVPLAALSEDILARIVAGVTKLLDGVDLRRTPELIPKTILELACSIQTEARHENLDDRVSTLAKMSLREVTAGPGADVLVDTASRIIARSTDGSKFLLRKYSTTSQRLLAVEQLSVNCPNDPQDVTSLLALMDLLNSPTDPVLLDATLEALSTYTWSEEALESLNVQVREFFLARVSHIVKTSRNVPLREASLPAFAWSINLGLRQTSKTFFAEAVDDLITAIDAASKEEQSMPSRLSAVRAVDHVQRCLYPSEPQSSLIATGSLLVFHRLILRLLQDDDPDIRTIARDIVCLSLGLGPTCLERIIELEWQWIGNATRTGVVDQAEAIAFLWTQCVDSSGFEQDIAALRQVGHQTDILFEVELPNQFRDSLVDSRHATRLLADIDVTNLNETAQGQWRWQTARLDSLRQQAVTALSTLRTDVTPIMEAFEARRSLHRRIAIHQTLHSLTNVGLLA